MEINRHINLVATVCAVLYLGILYTWSVSIRDVFQLKGGGGSTRTLADRAAARETQKHFDGIGPAFVDEPSNAGGFETRKEEDIERRRDQKPDTPDPTSKSQGADNLSDSLDKKHIQKRSAKRREYFSARQTRQQKEERLPKVPNTEFTYSEIPTFGFQDLDEVFARLDSVKAESDMKHSKQPASGNNAKDKPNLLNDLFQKLPVTPEADDRKLDGAGLFRNVRTRRPRKLHPSRPLVRTPGLFTKMPSNIKVFDIPSPKRTRAKRSGDTPTAEDQFTKWGLVIGVAAFSIFLFIILICACCKFNSVRRSRDGKSLVPDYTPPVFSVTEGYDNVACEDDMDNLEPCCEEVKHDHHASSEPEDHSNEKGTIDNATTSV